MDAYVMDDRLSQRETTRYYDHVGMPIPSGEEGYYSTVIRRSGVPGWVFRFRLGEGKLATETLANLNRPELVSA